MNKGCTIKGVCGKEPATAGLMDVLTMPSGARRSSTGRCAQRRRRHRRSRRMLDALFSTITNANSTTRR